MNRQKEPNYNGIEGMLPPLRPLRQLLTKLPPRDLNTLMDYYFDLSVYAEEFKKELSWTKKFNILLICLVLFQAFVLYVVE